MRTLLVDFLLLLVFLGTPLALILCLSDDGSASILPVLPILILGGIGFVKMCFVEEFFFEKWVAKWPLIAKPLLACAIVGFIYAEMGIVLHYKFYMLSIPNPAVEYDEADQALLDEFQEFHQKAVP